MADKISSALERIRATCPAMITLLGPNLVAELDSPAVETDQHYWLRVELMLLLRMMKRGLTEELGSLTLTGHATDTRSDLAPFYNATSQELEARLRLVGDLLTGVEAALSEAERSDTWSPLFAKLSTAYSMKVSQPRVFIHGLDCHTLFDGATR